MAFTWTAPLGAVDMRARYSRSSGPRGRLLAMDRDPEAVQSAERQFGGDPRFEIEQGTFTMLSQLVTQRRLKGQVNGMLLDLGVSSPQLDDAARGFSFLGRRPARYAHGPRHGRQRRAVAGGGREAGHQRGAVRLRRGTLRTADRPCHRPCARRERRCAPPASSPISIAASSRCASSTRHPATRSFQAIRIFINHELEELRVGA